MQDQHSAARVSDGYEPFFGLAESPFTLTASPRFLFESASYRSALKEIGFALSRREQIIVVTGPIGTGKTTLCRMIKEQRDPRAVVAVINTPPQTVDDLFRQILDGFDLLSDDTKSIIEASRFGLQKVLRQFLDSMATLKAQAIVVFDEAQHLPPAILEEIRLLLNLDTDRQLLQLVLVGQPELDELLSRTELGQMDQRVSRRHRLEPLQPAEVSAYVEKRLTVAKVERSKDDIRPTFTEPAMRAIASLSRGVPRVVNILCDRSLENAWSDKTHTVDTAAVVQAARSLNIDVPSTIEKPRTAEVMRVPIAHASPKRSVRFTRSQKQIAAVAGIAALAVLLVIYRGGAIVQRGRTPAEAPTAATPSPSAAAREASRSSSADRQARTPAPPVVADVAPKTAAPPDALLTSDKFLIVVSSFKTRDRSVKVAGDIVALGLPAFVRTVSGWEQVVVGPYSSRQEAALARDRLAYAHFEDSTITAAAPPVGAR